MRCRGGALRAGPGTDVAPVPTTPPFEQLDFVYMPSRDVAADLTWFEGVLGGRVVFAIEDGGTRVAMVELTGGPPRLLLTDHVEGEAPILVFRVADLPAAERDLRAAAGRPAARWRSRTDR